MKVGKNIRFSGRVQGVGFRDTVKMHATVLGLTGWVRNRSDGTVEAEVFGPAEKIDSLIQACRIGSALSQVENVVETPIPLQAFANFTRKETL